MFRAGTALLTVLGCLLTCGSASAAGLTDPLRATASAPTAQAVGLLADGTTGLATVQNVGGVSHLFAQSRPPGGTWGLAVDLGATTSATPVIETAGSLLLLAYGKENGGSNVALATLAPGGAGWSDLGPVAAGTAPRLSGAPDGSFVLAYKNAGNGLSLFRASSVAPLNLGTPLIVPGSANVGDLDVRRRANGDLVAAWTEFASATKTGLVRAVQAPTGGALGTPVVVATTGAQSPPLGSNPGSYTAARVAVTGTDAVIAFGEQNSGPIATFFGSTKTSRLTPGGPPETPQTIDSSGAGRGLVAAADDAGVVTLAFSASTFSPKLFVAIRPAGAATFPGTPVPVFAGPEDGQFPQLPALAASGTEALIVYGYGSGGRSHAVRRVGTTLQPDTPLEASSGGVVAAGGDGTGQFAVGYSRSEAGSVGSWTRFYDRTPPVLAQLAVSPGTAVVGSPFTFTTAATDTLSSAPPVTWTFGDGATAAGTTVAHAYATPGQPTVAASAVDEAGNVGTRTAQPTVTAAPVPPAVTPPVTPPVTALSPGNGPPPVLPPKVKLSAFKLTKTGVRLKLSGNARVRVAAERRRCRTVKGKKRCTYARPKRATAALKAGTRTVKLKLSRGTYRVSVRATNAAGTTKKVQTLKR